MPVHGADVVENVRKAFVERDVRPMYTSLSEEFSVPASTIQHWAAQGAWLEARAAHLQKLEKQSRAADIVLTAAKRADERIMRAFSDVIIIGLEKLSFALAQIPEKQAASTQAQTINTCSFAAKNFSEVCRTLGIVGFSKALDQEGKEANGRWNPDMLQQINVTVQNMTDKAAQPAEPVQAAAPEFSE